MKKIFKFTLLGITTLTFSAITGAHTLATTINEDKPVIPQNNQLVNPIELSGQDLITKVYGIIEPSNAVTKQDCIQNCISLTNLTPSEDEFGLWLEDTDGYIPSCYGISPKTSALAAYDNNQLENYEYFFIFPYSAGEREATNLRQAQFCGSLLQELKDLGLDMAASQTTDALFDVTGDNNNDLVEIRLIDETDNSTKDNSQIQLTDNQLAGTTNALRHFPGAGRFILILTIDPGASTPA
ncbi:MAG: hypothetical protein NC201_02085 [Prevotella sp.]|nr:hypothetical protein [Bacteroides sp.]MCM1366017.1 hypothetical protein [Prevotella sp.]MCM1436913.1 hypothetical protein [Prevotella sp.]